MQRKRLVVVLVALVVFLVTALSPRPAAASDTFTGPLLISAYILGGVTVIILVAILFADRDEPEFMRFMPPPPEGAEPGARLRLGTACPPSGANLPLACW